jgi:actin related protein 2/3 complex subunit 2
MLLLEDTHPALLNALQRMLRAENSVPFTAIKEFDGTEFTIQLEYASPEDAAGTAATVEEEALRQGRIQVVLSLHHPVEAKLLNQFQNFEEVLKALKFQPMKGVQLEWLPKTAKAPSDMTGHLLPAPKSAPVVVMTIPAGTPAPDRERFAEVFSSLRAYAYVPVFQHLFTHFLGGKIDAALPAVCLPYHTAVYDPQAPTKKVKETICVYSHRGGFYVCVTMSIPRKDDVVLAKNFLQTFADAKRLQPKELESAPAMSFTFGKAPPEIPAELQKSVASGDGDSIADGAALVHCTFQLQKSHMEREKVAVKSVVQIVNFRNTLLYHLHCCRSYMHAMMRKRVESSLIVLNRGKTSTTGKPRLSIK